MKSITKNAFGSLAAAVVLAFVAVFTPLVPTAFAQNCDPSQGVAGGVDCADTGNTPDTLFGADSIFTTIVNVLLFVIGAISVIMLIIGGIRYTISGGDSGNVTAAKNTIMYAIIGLVVAFLAFAIVNWVLGAITPQ
jgi:hypothetical protein